MKIPVEISARHVHLSHKDFEKLFGKQKEFIKLKPVSQPGQFATIETVEITNGKHKLRARAIGPTRKKSQLEISITDAYQLKLKKIPPVRISGNLFLTPKLTIKGPNGTAKVSTIIAKRHLHLSEKQAKKLKLKNKQEVKIKISGKRELTFHNVEVRAGKGNELAFQIDTDEANAAGINIKTYGTLVK